MAANPKDVQEFEHKKAQEIELQIISNILGQNGFVNINHELEHIFYLEGADFLDGNQWLLEALTLHCKTDCNFKPFFQAIYNAMHAVEIYQGDYETWAHDFQESQALTSIPATIQGHCLGLALIRNRLIYTNTGSGLELNPNGESGTFIFNIKDIRLITADFLAKCFQMKNLDSNQKTFMEHILSVVDVNQTPLFIPSKAQEVSNCVISSLKKNMKGMLACLWAFAAYGDLSDSHILEGVKPTLTAYKAFTDASLRNYAIDRLNKLCEANTDPKSIIFTTLLESISRYFHNRYIKNFKALPGNDNPNNDKSNPNNDKTNKDINRAKKLFDDLPDAYKAKLPHIEDVLYPKPINSLLLQYQCTSASNVNLNLKCDLMPVEICDLRQIKYCDLILVEDCELRQIEQCDINLDINLVAESDIKPVIECDIQPVTQCDIQPVTQCDIQPVTQCDIQPVTERDIQPATQCDINQVVVYDISHLKFRKRP